MEQREEIEEPVSTSYEMASWNKLNQLLDMYFNDDAQVTDTLTELTDAVQIQLTEQHLQSLPSLINKVQKVIHLHNFIFSSSQIQQLHLCLKNSKCVLLSGGSGSGKTMAYSTLASAYQYIGELRALGKTAKRLDNVRQCEEYPTVDITVLNPAAYTFDEVRSYVHVNT